jgi:hypothetical protein
MMNFIMNVKKIVVTNLMLKKFKLMVNGFVIVKTTIKDSCLILLVKILLVIEIVLMLISVYLEEVVVVLMQKTISIVLKKRINTNFVQAY